MLRAHGLSGAARLGGGAPYGSAMKLPADRVSRLRPFFERRAVIVTGGAGFIGGHLCDALVSLGADVTIIDDLSNSNLGHLAGLIELEPQRVRFVHGSILDDDAVAEAFASLPGPAERAAGGVVFHLAALGSVPRSIEHPQRSWSVNVTGTVRVLEASRRAGASRVVLASSSSVYGDDPTQPRRESMVLSPLSPYAASKAAGEAAGRAWSRSYGLSVVSLRFFNVFGPRQPADSAYAAVIPAFARKLSRGEPPVIFGDGSVRRDFTFVDDAVLALVEAGASPQPLAGEAFNIGSGRGTTIRELAALMAQRSGLIGVVPVLAPARAGDVKDSLADCSRASDVLGYQPHTRLEDGLDQTMRWNVAVTSRQTEGAGGAAAGGGP